MIEKAIDVNKSNSTFKTMELRRTPDLEDKLEHAHELKKDVTTEDEDQSILCNLLKGFRNSAENDSGHDSGTEETDYKSLLKMMTSCNVSDEKRNCKSTNKEKPKSEEKKTNCIRLHIKVKKQSRSSKKSTDSAISTDDAASQGESVENLVDKIANICLKSNESSVEKLDKKYKHEKVKNEDKKSSNDKSKPKNITLIGRGPIKCPVTNFRKQIPYESQVNRNALCGGKVVIKVTPPEDDLIPSTVNSKYSEYDIAEVQNKKITYTSNNNNNNNNNKFYPAKNVNVCDELNIIINQLRNEDKSSQDVVDLDHELNMIMEMIDSESKQISLIPKERLTKECFSKQKEIERFLTDDIPLSWQSEKNAYDTDENEKFFDENLYSPSYESGGGSFVNSPYSTDSPVPPTVQMSPYSCYQDQSYLNAANSYSASENLSPYSCSPIQAVRSPSMENADNLVYSENLLYEYSSVPSVSRESQSSSSSSSSDSPNFQNRESGIFDFKEASFPTLEANESYNAYQNYGQDKLVYTDKLQSVQYQQSKNQQSFSAKYVPIASKSALQCCVNDERTAKQVLEEMFNKLDDKTKKIICFKVHGINEDKLIELFDGQLSSWNEAWSSQFPLLPLFYATCERLLMRSTTMAKFFEVYVNGHTIIDRAILTCSKTPIVVKYLVECLLRALPHLPTNSDFKIEKADLSGNTVLHRAAGRGEHCGFSLASLLSVNNLSEFPIFNVNRLNADGYTPLHIACSRHTVTQPGQQCCCLSTVHILLEHGHADPNIKDGKSGNTPLHAAVDASICGPQLVSLLLKNGAKSSIRNYSGALPLDLAKMACRSSSRPQYSKQVSELLKKHK